MGKDAHVCTIAGIETKGKDEGIRFSMDGRGRALDNIFIERLWRPLKYEDIYLRDYGTVPDLEAGLQRPFAFCNHQRPIRASITLCLTKLIKVW